MRTKLLFLILFLLPLSHSAFAVPEEEAPSPQQQRTETLRRAIEDLRATFGTAYPDADNFLQKLAEIETGGDPAVLDSLTRQALLANPLLDFPSILLVRRRANAPHLGLPDNTRANPLLPRKGYDDEISLLIRFRNAPELTTIHHPEDGRFVGDLDLHFDANRLLFSSTDDRRRWQVFEIGIDGADLRKVTPDVGDDVDQFDACYLPDDRIIFASTACYTGIPCLFGNSLVANLCLLDEKSGHVRQLCFDQENNWCPTVMNDGRVMYQRWEYADLAHSNSRMLFRMNPDGTEQAELYGSNSYFPNSLFYARPIPGDASKLVTVISGHHGTHRSGRLLILDPARSRKSTEGVVREIAGDGGPVKPIVRDRLVDGVWPQFLHPFPLSDKYFLVACKPSPEALWGIYLVDVFDNMVLLKEEKGMALFEPVPLRRVPRPPVIPDRVDLEDPTSTVFLSDIYSGPALDGVPRGTVKRLRIVEYYFGLRSVGGLLGSIGMDGPWDIKRVLGTVPVEPDGSAHFTIPANTPVMVQPLDADGQALQLMRSWFTGMPGERISCVGCHAQMNQSPPPAKGEAFTRSPSTIEPWYGPPRGFNFAREVQPVLDRYCIGCHDGTREDIHDLRGNRMIRGWNSQISGHVKPKYGGRFSESYEILHRYVRRPGIESDLNLLSPLDFHASTTELIRMLRQGHRNVKLDREAWDRLITWIDLNAPYHGTWSEIVGEKHIAPLGKRMRELRRRFAAPASVVDFEEILPAGEKPRTILPDPLPESRAVVSPFPGWPFDAEEARKRQAEAGKRFLRKVDLGEGISLDLALIPAGEFVMGDADRKRVRIDRPFWIGICEVTNAQYACFDSDHDSRTESRHGYQFGREGYPLNTPSQPVVRISADQADSFCRWLEEKTSQSFRLPTEEEWEYACRAGTDTLFWYGDLDTDFSPFGNLGDRRLKEYAACTAHKKYSSARVLPEPNRFDDWVPKDDRFDDGSFVSADAGRYRPNPWGLHDMHGNVWEWVSTEDKGRIACGGSWYDRPRHCRSASRLDYPAWQRAFNVGFRVVCEVPAPAEPGP